MSLKIFPLLSVIIPYYNHNHFVRMTLDSIVEDTYPNKEIVIINDGSSNPDDSNITDWIEEHKNDIAIQYIKRENKGLTKTLNELVKLANGKYLALIASDDYFINNTFFERIQILQRNKTKKMLVSDAIVVDDNNVKLFESAMFEQRNAPKKNYFTDKGLKLEIIKRWSFVGPTSLIEKDLFDIVGYYNENFMIEDWDFYLRVVSQDLMLFYDKKVSAYRWHENNISKDKKTEYNRDLCLCQTQKENISKFKFPYNLILWNKARRCFNKLKMRYNLKSLS